MTKQTLLLDEIDRLKNKIHLQNQEIINIKSFINNIAQATGKEISLKIEAEVSKNIQIKTNQEEDITKMSNEIEKYKNLFEMEKVKSKKFYEIEEEYKKHIIYTHMGGNVELLIKPLAMVLSLWQLQEKNQSEEMPNQEILVNPNVDFENVDYIKSIRCWCGQDKEPETPPCLKCKNKIQVLMSRANISNFALAREEFLSEYKSQLAERRNEQ